MVELTVPASVLAPDEYDLVLQCRNGVEHIEEAAAYHFAIAR
jgi:hypothetical protein